MHITRFMGSLAASLLLLVCVTDPLSAQTVTPSQAGPAAVRASAQSAADMKSVERQANRNRQADDERLRRRDRAMQKSMKSICLGC